MTSRIYFQWTLAGIVLAAGMYLVGHNSSAADDAMRAVDFVDHGKPAPVSRHRGVAVTESPDGRSLILAWLSSPSDASLLVIDADTGETEQFPYPDRVRGRSFLLTDTGQFYTYGDSKLLVYDVNGNEMDVIEGPGRFGYAITEADDGTVYIALHPNANLLAYDPTSKELRDLGIMADPDDNLYYPRSLEVDETGWVYAGYGRNIITAFNPQTGDRRLLADEQEQGSGGARLFRGVDGAVYGRACARGLSHVDGHEPWQRFYAGRGEPLDDEPQVERQSLIKGGHSTVHRQFPDGRYLKEINIASLEPHAKIATSQDADEASRITFSYTSDGALIYAIAVGPDGRLYGSTGHPRYLFSFDPDTGQFDGLQLPGGHLNAMARQGDYLFGALYADGELHQYDPSQPWDADGNNPRTLVRARNPRGMITRPYLLEPHTDGRRVIMGGYYDRENVSGGGLVIYDIESGDAVKLSKHDLLVGHNPQAAAVTADGNLAVGTTVDMRNRAEEKATEAELFILDMERHEITFRMVPVPEERSLRDLRAGPERKRLYGITLDGTFFVFDLARQEVIHRDELSQSYGPATGLQAPRVLKLGPDGMFYLLFEKDIVQIDPETFAHRSIGTPPVSIRTGIVIHRGRLYFTHMDTLFSARLQELE